METFCYTFHVDVFVVVYSIIDMQSFKMAEDILLYLWKNDYMASKGVILVGNKADLERRREIPANSEYVYLYHDYLEPVDYYMLFI